MDRLYKAYRNGEVVVCTESLSEIRKELGLDYEQTRRIACPGTYRIADIEIITF